MKSIGDLASFLYHLCIAVTVLKDPMLGELAAWTHNLQNETVANCHRITEPLSINNKDLSIPISQQYFQTSPFSPHMTKIRTNFFLMNLISPAATFHIHKRKFSNKTRLFLVPKHKQSSRQVSRLFPPPTQNNHLAFVNASGQLEIQTDMRV